MCKIWFRPTAKCSTRSFQGCKISCQSELLFGWRAWLHGKLLLWMQTSGTRYCWNFSHSVCPTLCDDMWCVYMEVGLRLFFLPLCLKQAAQCGMQGWPWPWAWPLNSCSCQVEVQQFVRHVHIHQIVFTEGPISSSKTCHGSHHLVEIFLPCHNKYLVGLQDLTVSKKCLGCLLQMMCLVNMMQFRALCVPPLTIQIQSAVHALHGRFSMPVEGDIANLHLVISTHVMSTCYPTIFADITGQKKSDNHSRCSP